MAKACVLTLYQQAPALLVAQFLSPQEKARLAFILCGPYVGVSNPNWRCVERTGRPLQADGCCRGKALPVPRPLSGQPLIGEGRTQSESGHPAHIWTFSFLATVMLLPQKRFPNLLPSAFLEFAQACPALSQPSLPLLPVIPTESPPARPAFASPGLLLLPVFRMSPVTPDSFSTCHLLGS